MTPRPLKVVYVAGPFRAATPWLVEQNVRKAEALSLEVWRLGLAAICPHTNTRFFDGAAPDSVWLEGDLEIMRRCDAVLCTPDWSKSTGAKAELAEAERCGIPIFFSLADLRLTLLFRELRRVVGVQMGKVKDAIIQPERPRIDDALTMARGLRNMTEAEQVAHAARMYRLQEDR